MLTSPSVRGKNLILSPFLEAAWYKTFVCAVSPSFKKKNQNTECAILVCKFLVAIKLSSQHGSVETPTGVSLPRADVEEGGQSKLEKKFKALAQDS